MERFAEIWAQPEVSEAIAKAVDAELRLVWIVLTVGLGICCVGFLYLLQEIKTLKRGNPANSE